MENQPTDLEPYKQILLSLDRRSELITAPIPSTQMWRLGFDIDLAVTNNSPEEFNGSSEEANKIRESFINIVLNNFAINLKQFLSLNSRVIPINYLSVDCCQSYGELMSDIQLKHSLIDL